MGLQKTEDIQRLCRILLHQERLSQDVLFRAYHHYLSLKLRAFQCSYALDQTKGRLRLLDQDQQELNVIDLPRSQTYTGPWLPFATENLAVFDDSGRFLGLQERHKPQLSPVPWGGLAWLGSRAVHLDHLWSSSIPNGDCNQGPLDIYLPPQSEVFFVCDRGAGKVFCVDQPLAHLTAQLTIRPPGNPKGLNLAYSAAQKQCYLTSQGDEALHTINLPHRQHTQTNLQLGPLGNVVIHDRQQQLFVLVGTEKPAIQSLALADLSPQQKYEVPGQWFSQLDDPSDLMALSADGRYLYVMTYTDQPALMTPMVSILELQQGQWQQTHVLKKEDKPVGIGFQKTGLAPTLVPDFEQWLSQQGLLSPAQVQEALVALDKSKQESQKKPLAQDVMSKTTEIKQGFSEQELQSIVTTSNQMMADLLEDPIFAWEGRTDMSAAEKKALLEEMAALQPVKEVAQTNGVFVLNWIKGLMG